MFYLVFSIQYRIFTMWFEGGCLSNYRHPGSSARRVRSAHPVCYVNFSSSGRSDSKPHIDGFHCLFCAGQTFCSCQIAVCPQEFAFQEQGECGACQGCADSRCMQILKKNKPLGIPSHSRMSNSCNNINHQTEKYARQ